MLFYPATSTGTNTPLDTSGGTYPVVSFAHGLATSPLGEYTPSVTHVASSYSLFVEDNQWGTVLSTLQSPVLNPNATTTFHVLVNVPTGTGADGILVSARNDIDDGTRGTIELQTLAVPEPSGWALFAAGGLLWIARLRWRRATTRQ